MKGLNGCTSPSPTLTASSGVKDIVRKSVTSRQNHAAGHRGNEGEAWGTRRFNSQNTCSSVIIPKEEEIQMRCCFLPSFLKTADEEKKNSFAWLRKQKNPTQRKNIWPPTMHRVGVGDRKWVHSRLKCVSVSFSISQQQTFQHLIKVKDVIRPADFDVEKTNWTLTRFNFSRKHTKKEFWTGKKVVFIILTIKLEGLRPRQTPPPLHRPSFMSSPHPPTTQLLSNSDLSLHSVLRFIPGTFAWILWGDRKFKNKSILRADTQTADVSRDQVKFFFFVYILTARLKTKVYIYIMFKDVYFTERHFI